MLLWGKHLQKIVTRQDYNACTSLYYKKYLYVKWVGLGLTRPPVTTPLPPGVSTQKSSLGYKKEMDFHLPTARSILDQF